MLKIVPQHIKLFIAVLVLFVSSSFSQDNGLNNDLNRSFKKFDLVHINTQQALSDSRSSKMLELQTKSKKYELVLQHNDMRPARYRAEDTGLNGVSKLQRNEIATFKGFIKGEAESSLRINFDSEKVEGYFVSEGQKYFIESAKSYSSNAMAEDFIIYRSEDYLGENDFDCDTDIMKRIESGKDFVASSRGGSIANLEGPGVLELATEADLQFVNALGGATQANNEILFILNMVEGILDDQLNLSIEVVFQHTWTTADPFNGANSQALAKSFKDHWNTNFPTGQYPRDTAHLFSAKQNVLSSGYAYIGSVCVNPSFAYAISGLVSFNHGKFLVTSHELAHNVGGNHIDSGECGSRIMKSALTGAEALEFCQASRNEVGNFMNTGGDCLAPPVVSSRARFDFDGDNKTDTAIYRPTAGQWWYLRSLDGQNRAFQFGANSDTMVPADYTGDGKTDLAFWRESTGEVFVLRSEDSSFYSFPFGSAGDIPAPADYDGDGTDDFAVFRPTTTTWYILNSTGSVSIQAFGSNGDIPVVNDYDGDGFADLAIFRPDVQQWWINKTTEGVTVHQFGAAGDKPTPADFTGDGRTDIAFWRPGTGEWFVVRSEDSSFYSAPFGANGDIPAPGDYDGDGTADLTVWRPANKTWYILGSQNGFSAVGYGSNGDVPVPSSYIP